MKTSSKMGLLNKQAKLEDLCRKCDPKEVTIRVVLQKLVENRELIGKEINCNK